MSFVLFYWRSFRVWSSAEPIGNIFFNCLDV